ncbi:MAG: dienelactone hydrolase family protein, partial [Planctomycetaceae bacterium]
MPENPLAGFEESTFTHDGMSRQVFRAGAGPAVIVIHEVPGLHPEVIAFGRRVVEAGLSVYMPSLFGTPGKKFGWGYTLRTLPGVCVAREF